MPFSYRVHVNHPFLPEGIEIEFEGYACDINDGLQELFEGLDNYGDFLQRDSRTDDENSGLSFERFLYDDDDDDVFPSVSMSKDGKTVVAPNELFDDLAARINDALDDESDET